MPYQFSCPQGHLLQGDESVAGQILQCPVCGAGFLVVPPTGDAPAGGGFPQGPGIFPVSDAPPSFSPTTPMPQPQYMPGGLAPFGPPVEAQPPTTAPVHAAASPDAEEKPSFELDFDPRAKAELPFELPGQADSAGVNKAAATAAEFGAPAATNPFLRGPAAPGPLPAEPFAALPPAASEFSAPPLPNTIAPASAMQSGTPADDFLAGPAAARERPTAAPSPPKLLHIRCPSGHLVKAPSDLLGKLGRCPACKKTFELRYENSIEFQRRTQRILRQDENEAGKAWVAWAFLGAFLVFVALVGIVLVMGR